MHQPGKKNLFSLSLVWLCKETEHVAKVGLATCILITVFDLITAHTPYKRTVKQLVHSVVCRMHQCTFVYCFIKAYVMGTHSNCIDLLIQFKWVHITRKPGKKHTQKKKHSISNKNHYRSPLLGGGWGEGGKGGGTYSFWLLFVRSLFFMLSRGYLFFFFSFFFFLLFFFLFDFSPILEIRSYFPLIK